MKSLSTRAVILRRANVNEADRLLTLFTQATGKLTVKAKGVRKPLSKLAGGLELFYLSQFHLVLGNSLYTVTEVTPEQTYPNIHRDLKRLELAYIVAEIVNKLTHDGTKNYHIFELMVASFAFIETHELDAPSRNIFAGWFLIQFLAAEGIRPELKNCVFCHRAVEGEALMWSHMQGGLLHSEHVTAEAQAEPISQNLVKLMRLALASGVATVHNVKLDEAFAREFFVRIYDFFRWQTKVELKTIKNI
ncbi:DNA repair protein RecO [Candidatus Berkelbacteria bacterium]|nr:DNA repair protein RecO [Candidatus Berkelbacteria bacterium]